MKRGNFSNMETLAREGISILMKTLGPIETNRFLSHSFSRREESVRRHRKWQAGLDKDAFWDKTLGK